MPAIPAPASRHAHSFPNISFTSTLKTLFSQWIPPLIRPMLIFLLLLSISLTLFLLLRRLMRSAALRPRCSAPTSREKKAYFETLESTWPPVGLVALAPESQNLPNPTIRWNSPPTSTTPISPRKTKISRMKTWPAVGGILRSETMEEVNGCRRHVMVFGRQS